MGVLGDANGRIKWIGCGEGGINILDNVLNDEGGGHGEEDGGEKKVDAKFDGGVNENLVVGENKDDANDEYVEHRPFAKCFKCVNEAAT